MMIYPPIAKLVEKTGNRYILVIEAAKRARQLSEGSEPLCQKTSSKEVSLATNEIYEDKLDVFFRPELMLADMATEVLSPAESVAEETVTL